jgi:hypothetical protein
MKKYFQIILLVLIAQLGFGQVSAVITTKNGDFTIETKGIYKVVNSSESQSTTTQIGAPQLPVLGKTYALPQGSVVTGLSVTNGSKTEMGGGG